MPRGYHGRGSRDAKDQRKKNGKRRQRELNKKGDAKVGGDDLEAFRVKEPGTDNQGETSGKPNEVEVLQKEEIKVPEKDGPCDGVSPATVDGDQLGKDDVDTTIPLIVNDGDATVQKQTTPEPVEQEEVVEPAPQVISIEAPPSAAEHVPELVVTAKEEVVTAPVAEPAESTPPSVPVETTAVAEEKDVKDVVKTEEVRATPEPAEPAAAVPAEPSNEPNVIDQPTVNHIDAAVTENAVENEINGEVEVAELRPTEDNKEKPEAPVITKPQLKYEYKEDQWSPMNTEGKKQYDRTFLLQFQWVSHCMQKPDGLPNIEIVKDQAHKPKDMNMRNIGSMNRGYGPAPPDFTPGFIKPSPSGRGSMGHRRPDRPHGDQGRQRPPQGVKIISVSASFKEEVKLHSAEKAWKPVHKQELDPKEQKTEELYRRFRGILNKLTPQKFQTLVEQVLELDIDNEERLKGVIDLVFEKAISEPSFSVAYASMCRCLGTIKVQASGGGSGKDATIVNFRKLLLNRCQKEFEKDKSDELEWDKRKQEINASAKDEERKRLTEELQADIVKARRRSLGNIRFIGELFKLKILTEMIMHDCIVKLLKDSTDEDSLECLCKLMMTIGKELDNPKNKPVIDQYVQQLRGILQARKISSRVRFMIQDVIDLRLVGWVPRRDENNPKTIDQIHKEAQREEEAMHQALAQVQIQNKRPDDRRRQPAPRMQQPPSADDGWTAVPTKGTRTIDPSKLKITKPSIDENIQLGPGGSSRPAWVKGSSGGTKASTPENERPTTPANRFSALSQGPVEKEPPSETRRTVSGRLSTGRPEQKAAGRYPPQPQRKMSAPPMSGPMREREHEQAIANVRKFTGGQGSRSQSRENSRTREHEVREKPAPVIVNKDISIDEMEKKTTAIIDEFLHINDYTEAEKCFEELKHATGVLHIFVSTALNTYLERSSQARNHIATLLRNIIKKGNLPVTTYIKGLAEVLEFADDMSIDIPHIWTYLGELIGPMVQDGTVPFTFLREPFVPLVAVNKAGGLMAEVLHKASSVVGHNKIAELWKASGLKWAEFLNENTNESDWLRQQKLSFTVQQGEPVSPPVPISVETISSELTSLLRKRADNEEVFDWIETHVEEPRTKSKEFIRCLMKAVCFSAISGDSSQAKVNVEELKMRVALLHKFLENKEDRELQALFAVQALVNELSHPAGLFRDIIDTLYDDEVISEDAFCQWEHNDDPAEQEGRAIALKSAAQFFTWLHQTEKDES